MPQFTTPAGRLVWGHPLKMTNKLGDDNKPVIGPDGQPVKVTSFGVAFPKDVFWNFMIPKIMEACAAIYPQVQPPTNTFYPNNMPGHFAWKYVDGDASQGHRKGKPYNQREGYPGHMVMKFETMFPIVAHRQNGANWDQITDAMMKTGDLVAVGVNLEAHKEKAGQPRSTPGLYTNPNGVLHIADGPAIINAPDAQTMFGGQQFQIPQGFTAPGQMMPQGNVNPPGMQMPIGSTPGGIPGQAPQFPGSGQPMPGQGYQPQPMQQAPQYQPDPTFVQQAAGYQPQPMQQQPGPMGNGYAPTPGGPAFPGSAPVQYGQQPGAQSATVTYPSNPPMQQQPGPQGYPMPQGGMPGQGFPQR